VIEAVVYDSGMLIGLIKGSAIATAKHDEIIRDVRPVVPGPVLSQVWRDSPSVQAKLSRFLRRCVIHTGYDEDDYKRVGGMLGRVSPPGRKRPDFVDAVVAYTAAIFAPAAVMTSDSVDVIAYLHTLPTSQVLVSPV
jgi:hypothetical protein